MHQGPVCRLRLCGDLAWRISGDDAVGAAVVQRLAGVMELGRPGGAGLQTRDLRVAGPVASGQTVPLAPGVSLSTYPDRAPAVSCPAGRPTRCIVEPFSSDAELLARVISVSYVFSRAVESHGGLLIHGALAEWNGKGVILTGKSGIGKSTASGRLPPTWRSLSDDASLIVKSGPGRYAAHPWPTWSRIFDGETGASWPVGRGVPLAGIYFISRDCRVPSEVRPHPAVVLELLDLAYDVSWDVLCGGVREDQRNIRLQLFDNARLVAAAAPCRTLRVTLQNAFWETIETDLTAGP